MTKVVKTTFEQEQREKEETWLRLTPNQRFEIAYKITEMTRRPGVNYSYDGAKVKVTRPS